MVVANSCSVILGLISLTACERCFFYFILQFNDIYLFVRTFEQLNRMFLNKIVGIYVNFYIFLTPGWDYKIWRF